MNTNIQKVINIQLDENEALDLRSILHNYTSEYAMTDDQKILAEALKARLGEV